MNRTEQLQKKLWKIRGEGGLARFIAFAGEQGIPNPQKGIPELMEDEAGSLIPPAKIDALLLAATRLEERLAGVSDERELVFAEVQVLLRWFTGRVSEQDLALKLYGCRRKFNLTPSMYEHRQLARIRGGEFARVGGRGYRNYLSSLDQALCLRNALTELQARETRRKAAKPKVYTQLHALMRERFTVKPIGRLARRLAVEGIEISEASLMSLRAGRFQQTNGHYLIRERNALRLMQTLTSIGEMKHDLPQRDDHRADTGTHRVRPAAAHREVLPADADQAAADAALALRGEHGDRQQGARRFAYARDPRPD